jgi:hypothetical protein
MLALNIPRYIPYYKDVILKELVDITKNFSYSSYSPIIYEVFYILIYKVIIYLYLLK